jgi:hypothetical protein
MSVQQGRTLTAAQEAILYFVGLVLLYLASYAPPIAAPDVVRAVFTALGAFAVVIKFELASLPKPQITTHQAVWSVVAVSLSVIGGQVSANYAAYWYGGLILAIIGAVLAAYQDLKGKGKTPPVAGASTSPAPPSTAAPIATVYNTTNAAGVAVPTFLPVYNTTATGASSTVYQNPTFSNTTTSG